MCLLLLVALRESGVLRTRWPAALSMTTLTLSCLIKRTVTLCIENVRPLRGRPDNVENNVLQIFNPSGIVFAVYLTPGGSTICSNHRHPHQDNPVGVGQYQYIPLTEYEYHEVGLI